MNKLLTTVFLSITFTNAFCQILNDSIAQVITYWNKGEKKSYSISLQKIKLDGADTTSNELMIYDVDVTVLDSTDKSHTVNWFYHNYKTNSTNELIKKITAVSEDMNVIIETTELGTFQAVKNWEQVRDYIKKAIDPIRNDFKEIPQMDKVIGQVEGMFATKQAIESAAILDVQQFHFYHGAQYKLKEVLDISLQVPNVYYPQKPFDSKVKVHLDKINEKENNFTIRSTQEIDSEQLTNTTYEYLKEMAKTMGVKAPEKEEIGKFTNVITTDSKFHGTGWVIRSVQRKTVKGEGVTNIEERIIMMK